MYDRCTGLTTTEGEFSLDTKRTSMSVALSSSPPPPGPLLCVFSQEPAHNRRWVAAAVNWNSRPPTSLVAEKFHEPVCPVSGERKRDHSSLETGCLWQQRSSAAAPGCLFNQAARCLIVWSSTPHATHGRRSPSCQKLAISRAPSWVTGEELTRCDGAFRYLKGLWISRDRETLPGCFATKFFVQVVTFQWLSVKFQTTRLCFVLRKGFPALWTQTPSQQCFQM